MPKQESLEIASGWATLDLARSGSQEAWRVLFERHSPSLLRMAALITGSTDAARDCVQEAFVRAYSAVIEHREGTLRAYLSTIVYRLALKENVRQRRGTPLIPSDHPSPNPSPLDVAISDERQREVARVLRGLPDHLRDTLVLRFHGDHTYEEIAEITGVSLGTVKSRIFYAVKSARKALKDKGVE